MKALTHYGARGVVTGAGKGIGRAYALELARRGSMVLVNDIDRAAADDTVEAILAEGGIAVPSYEAVGSRETALMLISQVQDAFGGVEFVISNAGILRPGYFEELSESDITAVMDVHLLGPVFLAQAVWAVFKQQKYGRLVLTGSASGMFGHQGQANYCAAKAGVFGLTKALAYEGKDSGILVNMVMPYATSTIMDATPIPDLAVEYGKYLGPELAARYGQAKSGPQDIAHMVSYLASRECSVTGEAYSICAGRYARVFVGVADGWLSTPSSPASGEAIAEQLGLIRDIEHHSTPKWLYEEVASVARRL